MLDLVKTVNYFTCAKEFQFTIKGDSLEELADCINNIKQLIEKINKGENV